MTPTLEQIEHRRIWTDDLRNGGHKQIKGHLEIIGVGWCCHGRACRLAIEDGVELRVTNFNGLFAFEGCTSLPPFNMYIEWLGMNQDDVSDLANANDDGKTFAEIADMIDRITEMGR